jgi:hypothetical protein
MKTQTRFITEAQASWSDAKPSSFVVVAPAGGLLWLKFSSVMFRSGPNSGV